VEVRRWMHFHDFDLHYCLLGFGIREMLATRILRIF
jgi:hypothetical protein